MPEGDKQTDPWTSLLDLPPSRRKKVKDPLHKDIKLTKTEVKIIDTERFQRLRFIHQLGPAYLVYPSAVHTRFEHSLGTLHLAQHIIDEINSNSLQPIIKERETFIVRLVALLHDLAHLPFGHTLEDEGMLFPEKQWLSPKRHEIFFKPTAKIIKKDIVEAFKACKRRNGKLEAINALYQIQKTLVAEEKGNVDDLEQPYISDIVGNTICADLLDYLKRDSYFTGLSEGYDERVTSYFTVQKVGKNGQMKERVVIRLFKEERKQVRHDVLSALTGLLERRYSLGEKVYFHHAKRAASAMIIKLVASAMKAGVIDETKLCELNDVSLLHYIRHHHCRIETSKRPYLEVAKKLEERLSKRDLYKPIYELAIVSVENKKLIDALIECPEQRYEFEEGLEDHIKADKGDVIAYVPKREMQSKEAEVLVQLPSEIKGKGSDIYMLKNLCELEPLADYKNVEEILKGELATLQKKHHSLWRLSIFAHKTLKNDPDIERKLRDRCGEIFGIHGLPYATVRN